MQKCCDLSQALGFVVWAGLYRQQLLLQTDLELIVRDKQSYPTSNSICISFLQFLYAPFSLDHQRPSKHLGSQFSNTVSRESIVSVFDNVNKGWGEGLI